MLPLSRHQWTIALVLTLVLGSAFIVATRVQPQTTRAATPSAPAVPAERPPAPLADHPAPGFTLQALDGSSVSLDEMRGQVVLLNIWATWCPPCRAEMPAMQAIYQQYRDEGFTVLAVNMQEDPATVEAFMQAHDLTFPVLLDTQGEVSGAYHARVLPSSFFIDRQGTIRAVYRGPLSRGVMDGMVRQLLAETGGR